MNHDNLIENELEQAGKASPVTPQTQELEERRITKDRKLQPMDFLFRLFGIPCFPRRELVGITGKAKSGKTFLTSMLMACCLVRNVLSFSRAKDESLRVLWFDTEQSDESTQDILCHRILPMAQGNDAGMDIFNVRGVPWKDRRRLLLEAVASYGPDLVIVDGIRDLVNDINDGVLAQEVMEELMHLAATTECCIVCVLHQNKSGEDHNLRGWIGTELMNKPFEVYSCEKQLPDRIFQVEQTLTRKYDIGQPLYFRVDKNGLPVACQGAGVITPKASGWNEDYVICEADGKRSLNVKLLFEDAIGCSPQMQGSDLKDTVMTLANIEDFKLYAQLLNEAVNSRIILKSYDTNRHVIYTLNTF